MVAPHPAIHPCVHGCRAPPYSHPWGWRRVWWPWRSHHHSASMELRAHANRGLCLQMESGLARRSTRRHLLCSPPFSICRRHPSPAPSASAPGSAAGEQQRGSAGSGTRSPLFGGGGGLEGAGVSELEVDLAARRRARGGPRGSRRRRARGGHHC
jgi:hypothetical protein